MSCDPGPGETVRFRGEFTETIAPTRSGTVLYDIQDIASVNGFIVTFNQEVGGINPGTDYVTVYGSRKGNSGAFAVMSASGNQIAIDTSDLPAGQFLSETVSDPGDLRAAILRPVHFTAWDKNDPPVWDGDTYTFRSTDVSVIMVSHIKSISGWPRTTAVIWPAFEIGSGTQPADFHILDHLEVINAECAIATDGTYQANYNIIQFNNLHDTGYAGSAADEVIYFGHAFQPERHHDYVQIMYNKVGPHKYDPDASVSVVGDGIEIKQSAHHATVFGNEVVGIWPNGCADAPIRSSGAYAFIANNYVHDIYNNDTEIQDPSKYGCGISIINDRTTSNPEDEAYGTIIANNIVANVKEMGIRVLDTDNVQILNNVVYNIIPKPDCDSACMEENTGIMLQNWQGSTEDIVIKNNIVQGVYIGIGRWIWSSNYPVSIDSDYNIVFDATYPFRGTIAQNAHDLLADPKLTDPSNHNFVPAVTSPARDSGTDLTGTFSIDNHDAANPRLPDVTAPIVRTGAWDRGIYEH